MNIKKIIKFSERIFDVFMKDFSSIGSMVFYGLVMIMFFILEFYKISLFLLLSFILLSSITIIIRSIYFKTRPNVMKHNSFFERLDASSFPSVHSARIIVLFLTYLFFFEINLSITIVLGAITLCVLYSRIYLKKHYLIDVVFGVLNGFVVGVIVNYLVGKLL